MPVSRRGRPRGSAPGAKPRQHPDLSAAMGQCREKPEEKKNFFKGLAIAGCGQRPGQVPNSTQIPNV